MKSRTWSGQETHDEHYQQEMPNSDGSPTGRFSSGGVLRTPPGWYQRRGKELRAKEAEGLVGSTDKHALEA